MVLEFIPKSLTPYEQTYSKEIVYLHCAIKGMQVGLVLSPLFFGLYSTAKYLLKNEKKFKFSRLIKYSNIFILLGIAVSDAMAYQKLNNSDLTKNQSRAFRLLRNQSQNLTDNFMLVGMLSGHFLLRRFSKLNKYTLAKCNIGGTAGVILAGIYNNTGK